MATCAHCLDFGQFRGLARSSSPFQSTIPSSRLGLSGCRVILKCIHIKGISVNTCKLRGLSMHYIYETGRI